MNVEGPVVVAAKPLSQVEHWTQPQCHWLVSPYSYTAH